MEKRSLLKVEKDMEEEDLYRLIMQDQKILRFLGEKKLRKNLY